MDLLEPELSGQIPWTVREYFLVRIREYLICPEWSVLHLTMRMPPEMLLIRFIGIFM